MKLTIEKSRFLLLVLFLLSLGATYPFVHNYLLFEPVKAFIGLVFLIILLLIVFNQKKINFLSKEFNTIYFIQLLYIIMYETYWQSDSFYQQIFNMITSWLYLLVAVNVFEYRFLLKNIIRINILSLVLTVVGFILFSLGYLVLINAVDYNGTTIFNYGFFFLKRNEELDSLALRPAGYYDEPGSLAFIVMFLLLINHKFFNKNIFEYLLLILTFVTTSLAHIFTSILYVVFFQGRNMEYRKIVPFIIAVVLLIFYLNTSNSEFSLALKAITIDRFENYLNGNATNDPSRAGGLEYGPLIFKEHIFGYHKDYVFLNYPNFIHETFWGPLIYHGIVGIWFYYLPFLYIFIKSIYRKNINNLCFLILIAVNLLQRPYYISPIFIIFIYFLFFFDNKKHLYNK